LNYQEVKQSIDLSKEYKFAISFENDAFNMNPFYNKVMFAGRSLIDDAVDTANEAIRNSQAYLRKYAPEFSSELKDKSKQAKFALEVSAQADFQYITVREGITLAGTRKQVEKATTYMRREGIDDKKLILSIGVGQDDSLFNLKCLLAKTIKADIDATWADPRLYWNNFLVYARYANSGVTRYLSGVPRANAKSGKSAVLATSIYLADIVSHATIHGGGKTPDKNQKRLSDYQLRRIALAKSVRENIDDLGLYRRAEYLRADHTQLNCLCPVCQYAGSTIEDFFVTYNKMAYQACGTHNAYTDYHAINLARGHIGRDLKRFFMGREQTKRILSEWYHMNLGQRPLGQGN
jgi:hypothetical protein